MMNKKERCKAVRTMQAPDCMAVWPSLMEVRKLEIKIYGPGCLRCGATETNVRKVLKNLGIKAKIKHIYDIPEFAKAGVKKTPGVVADGKLVSQGVIPTIEELTEFFSTCGNS